MTKARKTGTIMATSPIAESLITAICWGVFGNEKILIYF
jgi:hypothetical protein